MSSRVADKLVSPEEAVGLIKHGDVVFGGGWTSVPPQLCGALSARGPELRNVTIVSFLTPYKWDTPENLANFNLVTAYCSPLDRAAVREGRMEYIPVSQFREGKMPPGIDRFDVALIPISPPDEDGWCSYGSGVFFGPTVVSITPRLIGEVHENFIRTGGDNRIHISRFEKVIEYTLPPAVAPIPPRSEETELAAQVICTLVANEIVYDGCTVQFGIGDVSAALPAFLEERHDLGVHTELLPGGIPDLVDKGVITGRNKPHHVGKIVASAIGQVSPEDMKRIDGNPVYELYDFTHTDDLRLLLQSRTSLPCTMRWREPDGERVFGDAGAEPVQRNGRPGCVRCGGLDRRGWLGHRAAVELPRERYPSDAHHRWPSSRDRADGPPGVRRLRRD